MRSLLRLSVELNQTTTMRTTTTTTATTTRRTTTRANERLPFWLLGCTALVLISLLGPAPVPVCGERDFNLNDSQVPVIEPKDEPAYKPDPYVAELIRCRQSKTEFLLSLVLKQHDWSELSADQRAHVQTKLAKFFAIPKEFVALDSVSKHDIKIMHKKAMRRGGKANKNAESQKQLLGRASFVIGCDGKYFGMGEPIAKQIAHQVKDGTIGAITEENFGLWFIWNKELKSRSQRTRRQTEGSGVEGEDEYDYDYGDDDAETPEPITEVPTPSTHAHRHHHGVSELTENAAEGNAVPVAPEPAVVVNPQAAAGGSGIADTNDLLEKESFSKLESVIIKTIENTKNIKELPVMSVEDVAEDVVEDLDMEQLVKTPPLGVPAAPEILESDKISIDFDNELELKRVEAEVLGTTTSKLPGEQFELRVENTTAVPLVPIATLPGPTTAATVKPSLLDEDAAGLANNDTPTSISHTTNHNNMNVTPATHQSNGIEKTHNGNVDSHNNGYNVDKNEDDDDNDDDDDDDDDDVEEANVAKNNRNKNNKAMHSFSPYDVSSSGVSVASIASTIDTLEPSVTSSSVSTFSSSPSPAPSPSPSPSPSSSPSLSSSPSVTSVSTGTAAVVTASTVSVNESDTANNINSTTATTTTTIATPSTTQQQQHQSQTPKPNANEQELSTLLTNYNEGNESDAAAAAVNAEMGETSGINIALTTRQSISDIEASPESTTTLSVAPSTVSNKEEEADANANATAIDSNSTSSSNVSTPLGNEMTTPTSSTPPPTTPQTPAATSEVSSSTAATTEYVEPQNENTAPIIKTRLQKLAVTSGKAFTFVVPEDTFADAEDQTNLRLHLTDKDGHELKHNSWLQFNADKRELYGLPLDDTVSRWQYRLSATDSGNESVSDTVEISVQQHRAVRTVNHEISIAVKINEKHGHNIDWQLKLIQAIGRTLEDASSSALVVREVRQTTQDPQNAVFVYFNETLPTSECPEAELNSIVQRLDAQRLSDLVQPLLSIKSITGQLIGSCQKSEISKPKPTLHMAKNFPPIPRNQVDRVNASVGQLLVYKVPSDTFYDPNDNDLILTLRSKDNKELSTRHWLQFDSKNQEFYGIPKSGDTGSEEYLLMAEDSGGLSATDALVVVVNHAPKKEFGVFFKAYLAIRHENFNADLQRKFVERIAQLHGDPTTSLIQVRSITTQHDSDSTIVNFYNTSLYKMHNRCPEKEIALTRNVYFTNDLTMTLRDSVKTILGPELNLTNLTVASPSCHQTMDINLPFIPTRTEEPSLKSTFSQEYFATFILPAVIIVVMILLAAIVACCFHRRRHKSGKMELGDEEERKSFRAKGIPVIFQDEFDEKPEIGNKSPVILKDEKPPLLAPPYSTSNMNGENDVDEYVPPPAVVVGGREVRGKSPATPSYRKPPPYVSP